MSYCPKCGVELDTKIQNCPLCEFPMSIIDEHLDVVEPYIRFPEAENIYMDIIIRLKNQIFFVITMLLFSATLVLLSIRMLLEVKNVFVEYSMISVISLWFYLFFVSDFIKNKYYAILGIGVSTIFLTYNLDYFDGILSWSISYAMPIVILSIIVIFTFMEFYKRSKHKNQFIFVTIYICIEIAILCVGIESIIDYNFAYPIRPSWSAIVFVVLMSIAILLFVLYSKMPDKIKDKLRKKFHV